MASSFVKIINDSQNLDTELEKIDGELNKIIYRQSNQSKTIKIDPEMLKLNIKIPTDTNYKGYILFKNISERLKFILESNKYSNNNKNRCQEIKETLKKQNVVGKLVKRDLDKLQSWIQIQKDHENKIKEISYNLKEPGSIKYDVNSGEEKNIMTIQNHIVQKLNKIFNYRLIALGEENKENKENKKTITFFEENYGNDYPNIRDVLSISRPQLKFNSNKSKALDKAIAYVKEKEETNFKNIEMSDFLKETYFLLTRKKIEGNMKDIDIIVGISDALWDTYREVDINKTQEIRNLLLQPEIIKIIIEHELQSVINRIKNEGNKIKFENKETRKNKNLSDYDYQTLIDTLYQRLQKIWKQVETYPGMEKIELETVSNDKISEYYNQIKHILTKGLGLKESDERYNKIMKLFLENSLNKISHNMERNENGQLKYKSKKIEGIRMKPYSNMTDENKHNYITKDIELYEFLHTLYKRLLYIYERHKSELSNEKCQFDKKIKMKDTTEKIKGMFKVYYETGNINSLIESKTELQNQYRQNIIDLLDCLAKPNGSDNKSNSSLENIRNKIYEIIPVMVEGTIA